jgi:phosphatidylethanolamine/phosphatidyl-N-methylethanolamine N-methyltransferase
MPPLTLPHRFTRRFKRWIFPTGIHNRHMQRQFLVMWAKAPRSMGAVLPSSRALARAMAQQAKHSTNATVVELGAGTGIVTHALLEAHIAPEHLLVVEREPVLVDVLHTQFPSLRVVHGDAQHLLALLQEHSIEKTGCVVSSLPLLNMPQHVREAIEAQMVTALDKGGVIVQFTYGMMSPIPRSRWVALGIYGRRVRRVVANIPPATVWVFKHDRREKKRA